MWFKGGISSVALAGPRQKGKPVWARARGLAAGSALLGADAVVSALVPLRGESMIRTPIRPPDDSESRRRDNEDPKLQECDKPWDVCNQICKDLHGDGWRASGCSTGYEPDCHDPIPICVPNGGGSQATERREVVELGGGWVP